MSIATYLGCNLNLEITDELTTYNLIDVGYIFSEEENRKNVKEKHFSTKNVYEIQLPNPLYDLNVFQKKNNPRNYKKSKKDFIALCNFLNQHLNPGEYCEIYPCWLVKNSNQN
ncbi:hypothetical protein E2K98_12800 [Bacillus salipaludis]|uniref:Uncharacterized protein n=1 Tax=Bacillus salipaludis TaxID=2547811 RepID=A0A4R5VUL0_9BACI|nr:hypothetical protein [Bacillus salipaludis]TDK61762.1 hypothetical protein E2K98_12800 [Bacillus salipaludis]